MIEMVGRGLSVFDMFSCGGSLPDPVLDFVSIVCFPQGRLELL